MKAPGLALAANERLGDEPRTLAIGSAERPCDAVLPIVEEQIVEALVMKAGLGEGERRTLGRVDWRPRVARVAAGIFAVDARHLRLRGRP